MGVVGTFAGQMEIQSNDANEMAFDFSGQGIVEIRAAEITVLESGVTVFDEQSQAINFGSAIRGAAGPIRTFTIQNDGNIPLLLLSVISLPPGFIVESARATSIQLRMTTTLRIQMLTDVAGLKGGTVSFTTNDSTGGESQIQINLRGQECPTYILRLDEALISGVLSG